MILKRNIMKQYNERKAGSILSYINLAISCIIPLLYTPVMLELLGQEEYGLYTLSNSVVGYLSLLNFGMGSAVIRYVSRYRAENRTEDVRRTLGLFMTIYCVLSLLVCIGGAVLIGLSGRIFGRGLNPEEIRRLRVLMVIMTLSTAVSFPMGVLSTVTVVYERYIFNKLVSMAESILLPVVNLAIMYAGGASVGMACAALLMQILNGVVYGGYNLRRLGIYPVFRNMPLELLREVLVFSAFVFLSSVVDMLYWATDKVLIGATIGSAAVAVYNVGGTFTVMLQNMAHAISSVFSPQVNIMVARKEPMERLSELLIRIGRLQYLVVSLVLSGYLVFGRDFIRMWAGKAYAQAYYVGLMTMLPLAVPLIQNIAFAVILAQNKHRFRSVVYAIIAVINVISTWLILPYYGILGAAACTAAAYILGQGLIMNVYYYKVTGLDIPAFWRNIGRMSIVPGVMIAAGISLIGNMIRLHSLVQLLLGAVVYTIIFAALSWLISMNRYEKDLFVGLVKGIIEKLKGRRK